MAICLFVQLSTTMDRDDRHRHTSVKHRQKGTRRATRQTDRQREREDLPHNFLTHSTYHSPHHPAYTTPPTCVHVQSRTSLSQPS
mmetsp:Transcript_11339/g.27431  ORF Transcript_11339/g.27431 Transcript_11339/m.27431 type:complete len:85 (-) Transcript_11339:1077-1331(-)